MNKFGIYFHKLSSQEKKEFAVRCETTVARLRNIAYGFSSPSVGVALILERESKGGITLKDLRPNDWFKYRSTPLPESHKEGV